MKIRNMVLMLFLSGAWGLAAPEAPPTPTRAPSEAYLRYLCSAGGGESKKNPGEQPLFKPARQLVFQGGSAGVQILAPDLLPLSVGGYRSVALAPGKLVVRNFSDDPTSPSSPPLASLAFAPKAGRFYTLMIRGGDADLNLDLLEDEPAVVAAAKEGEPPPPPRRSLRCVVLEPGIQVTVAAPAGRIKLVADSSKAGISENLQPGIWMLEIQGKRLDEPFKTNLELDLTAPGNWTIFFMHNIYGTISPYLQKDGSLE